MSHSVEEALLLRVPPVDPGVPPSRPRVVMSLGPESAAGDGAGGAGGNPTLFASVPVLVDGHDKRIGEEAGLMAEGQPVLAAHLELRNRLYSYRGAVRAVPQVTKELLSEAPAIYDKTRTLLANEIKVLHQLVYESNSLVAFFCKGVSFVASGTVSDEFLDLMVDILSACLVVDAIKGSRTSLTNELTAYKRAVNSTTRDQAENKRTMETGIHLASYLAGTEKLRKAVKAVSRHDDALVKLLRRATSRWETQQWTSPDDKHNVIRGIVVLFLCLDSGEPGADVKTKRKTSAFFHKTAPKAAVFKVLEAYPVLPVLCDVSWPTFQVFSQLAPAFDRDLCSFAFGDTAESTANMMLRPRFVALFSAASGFTARWQAMVMRVKTFVDARRPFDDMPAAFRDDVFRLCREGLQTLTALTSAVLEQSAAKTANPVVSASSTGTEWEQYERAVRDNYSPDERSLLVEAIGLIKTTAGMMERDAPALVRLIRYHVHARVQAAAHGVLSNQLAKARRTSSKSKESTLLMVRGLVAEWTSPSKETLYVERGKKKEKGLAADDEAPAREVGLSPDQQYALRAALKLVLDESSEFRASKLFKSAFLIERKYAELKALFDDSYYFPVLLNLQGAVREAANLGQLWYRESFMDRCRCVQFPIETSLPWVLIEHTLAHPFLPLTQNLLHLFGLYDDSAGLALRSFARQHMFAELEAETNLAFDQCFAKLAAHVYDYTKDSAAAVHLPPAFRTEFDKRHEEKASWRKKSWWSGDQSTAGMPTVWPHEARLDAIVRLRDFQLLGRSVDLTFVVSRHVERLIIRDLEKSVVNFENDMDALAGLIDFQLTRMVLSTTHTRLAHVFDIQPFDMMVAQVEEDVTPIAAQVPRSMLFILLQVIGDLVTQHRFCADTQRFVRCASSLENPATPVSKPSKKIPVLGRRSARAGGVSTYLSRGFFGVEHADALVRVLGVQGTNTLVEQLMANNVEPTLVDLADYFPELIDGLRPYPLPKYEFMSAMVFESFRISCGPLLQYADLKGEVFQPLRVLGNTLALIHMLDGAVQRLDQTTFLATGALVMDSKLTDVAQTAVGAPAVVSAEVADVLPGIATRAAEVCNKLKFQFPLFRKAVAALATGLTNVESPDGTGTLVEAWTGKGVGQPPGYLGHLETLMAATTGSDILWHSLWSALLFVFCLSPDDADEYGDGFYWAGTTITYLLGQRRRFEVSDPSRHIMSTVEFEAAGPELDEKRLPKAPTSYTRRLTKSLAWQASLQRRLELAEGKGDEEELDAVKLKDEFIAEARPALARIEEIFTLLETSCPDHIPNYPFSPKEPLCGPIEYRPPEEDEDYEPADEAP